jgi:pimeloyl-ACP methyl ester carboxylesterase
MPPAPSLPVVYLPGMSGRSSVWRPIAERLAGRRTPILVEYPGFGGAPTEPSIRDLSDLSHFLLERLPWAFDLVALSMGGAVALHMAMTHPERIRSLVLVTTANGVDVQGLGGIDVREPFRRRRPDAPPWFLDDRTDLTPRLGVVASPTLLVFGDRDPVAPVRVGEHLEAHLGRARLEIVAGATHDLEAEQPDVLASLIEAHFRRGADGPSGSS